MPTQYEPFDTHRVSEVRECVALKAYLIDDVLDPIFVYPGETDSRVDEAVKKTLWWNFDLIHGCGETSLLVPISDPYHALVDCLSTFSGTRSRLVNHQRVNRERYNAEIEINGLTVEGSGDHMFRAILSAFLRYESGCTYGCN